MSSRLLGDHPKPRANDTWPNMVLEWLAREEPKNGSLYIGMNEASDVDDDIRLLLGSQDSHRSGSKCE